LQAFGEHFFELRAPKLQLAVRQEFLEIGTGRYLNYCTFSQNPTRTEISGFEFGRRRPGWRGLRGATAAGRSEAAAGAAAATTAGEARAAGAFASAASAVASAAATVAGVAGAYSQISGFDYPI
jgi:hypothetical protein